MAGIRIGLMYNDLKDVVAPGPMGEWAERWGYDALWAPDHALKQRLDPLTVLAAVSQRTTRLRLGTAVMVLPYRHPYLTAKAAVSVDVVSEGRLMLGLGIGDLFHEFEALEIDRRLRGRLSDERLDIIRRLLHEENVSYRGKFHRFDHLTLLPRPVQKPSIPIWLGGHWEEGGFVEGVLRRSGRFADGFIPTYATVPGYLEAKQQISRYAEESGRDPGEIEWGAQIWTYIADSTEEGRRLGSESMKSRQGLTEVHYDRAAAIGSAEDIIETLERYAEIGVTQFNLSAVCQPQEMAAHYERIGAEVIPHFR